MMILLFVYFSFMIRFYRSFGFYDSFLPSRQTAFWDSFSSPRFLFLQPKLFFYTFLVSLSRVCEFSTVNFPLHNELFFFLFDTLSTVDFLAFFHPFNVHGIDNFCYFVFHRAENKFALLSVHPCTNLRSRNRNVAKNTEKFARIFRLV